ncbi:MAG: hypothetical protein HFG36_09890 [Eubacterium sp.]|nr:hypothetical protein [Eubacterium sp.]
MVQTVRIEMDKMNSIMKKADDSAIRTRKKISKFDKSAEKTQRSLEKWAKEKYKILMEVGERITPVMQALGSSIMYLTGKTWHAKMKAVDLFTAPLRGIRNILKNDVSHMGEAASAAGVMQYSIESAALSLGCMENAGEEVSMSAFIEAERQKALINQQKSYDVLGMDIDDVKIKTKELNEDNVVLVKTAKEIQNYSEATNKIFLSQTNLNSSSLELNKQNWKVSLGMKLDKAEREECRITVNNFVEDARTYLEEPYYQSTMFVELLLGKDGCQDITVKLFKKQEAAPDDGVINEKEQKEISQIQVRILSVTNKVFEFDSTLKKLAARTQSISQDYSDAMQSPVVSLELMKGDMSDEEYQEKYKEIRFVYKEKVDALSSHAVNFQFDVLKDNKVADSVTEDQRITAEEKFQDTIPTYVQSFIKEYMSDPTDEMDGEKAEAIQTVENNYNYRVVTFATNHISHRSEVVSPNYCVTSFESNLFFDKGAKLDKKGLLDSSGEKDSHKKSFLDFSTVNYLSEKKKASRGDGEWTIPTNPSRRARALGLYKQLGYSLGVGEHTNSGLVAPYTSCKGDNGSEKNTTIELNVSVNPEFTVNGAEGQNSEDVIGVIRRHIRELADELGGEIASQLEMSFSNRPLKEA